MKKRLFSILLSLTMLFTTFQASTVQVVAETSVDPTKLEVGKVLAAGTVLEYDDEIFNTGNCWIRVKHTDGNNIINGNLKNITLPADYNYYCVSQSNENNTTGWIVELRGLTPVTVTAPEETVLSNGNSTNKFPYFVSDNGNYYFSRADVAIYVNIEPPEGTTIDSVTFNNTKIGTTPNGYYVNYSNINSGKDATNTLVVTVYDPSAHTHSFTYAASENILTATCTSDCTEYYATPLKLTLTELSSLVYTGSPISLNYGDGEANAWKTATDIDAPTIEYYLSDGTTKTTATNSGAASEGAAPVNAGTYIAKATVDTDKTATKSFTITKANASATAPIGKESLVYSGIEQKLIATAATNVVGGTAKYSLDNTNWKESIDDIKATDVGSHTVYWKVDPDANHNEVNGTINVTISKAPLTIKDISNKTYTGSEIKPDVEFNGLQNSESLVKDTDYTLSYSENVNAGNNTASVTVALQNTDKTKNYSLESNTKNFSIIKATDNTISLTKVDDLISNGTEQKLLSSASATYGDIKFAITETEVEPGSYTITNINDVKKADKGTYYVWAKVEGTDNYNEAKTHIEVIIATVYEITQGKEAKINVNDKIDATFTSVADISEFKKVIIDGTEIIDGVVGLENDKCKVTEGSTNVTLKSSYLDTLSSGTHTLSIVSTYGKAETTFTITRESKPSPTPRYNVPNTGVEGTTNNHSLLKLSSLSLLAIGTYLVIKKKKDN